MKTTEQQHNERKQELMEKCFECYADNGFSGVWIRFLGQYCGTNPANLYTYFKDVDDIIIQSTEYCMSKVEDDFMSKAPSSAGDLERFIDEIPYWTAKKHGKKYRLMYQVYTHPKYVVAKASLPVAVTGYTFTTGNDNTSYKGRNLKCRTLYGTNDYSDATKNDDKIWTKLHSVSGDTTMQDKNFEPYSFTFSNDTFYQYYKLNITENQSGNCTQLCELEFTYRTREHSWENVTVDDLYRAVICG